jgi:hypothetical protein
MDAGYPTHLNEVGHTKSVRHGAVVGGVGLILKNEAGQRCVAESGIARISIRRGAVQG